MTAGLLELGEIMLAASERRLEIVSRNVSNTSAPGFKASIAFQDALTDASAASGALVTQSTDFAQGALRATGGALDLAVSGPGFFRLRAEDRIYYTRNGQFERAPDGRVTNARGLALQTADGGDLIVGDAGVEILQDGLVLENGVPIARIGLFEPTAAASLDSAGGTLFAASAEVMQDVATPLMHQGMIETANVDMASQMIDMMAALRQAEVGARVVQAYDSLLGQSISTFGAQR